MLELVSAAIIMGLSSSTFCLASCVPVLFPYTGTVEKPSIVSGLSLALLFSIGRLIAYVSLLTISILFKEFVGFNSVATGIALLFSGLLLILSAMASFGIFKRPILLDKILCRYVAGDKSPLYLGLMSGIRPCGPLLAAIAFVITLSNAAEMGVFLLSFWLASSAILIIIGGVGGGVISMLGKQLGVGRMRRIAAIAMAFVGIIFILQAIGSFSML